ncbi:type I methionyl aminopeptidase [Pigmentiphaga sp. GD03639]|uniref:Methionine aminopeptidase n=1 Tax=Pigmentiphaga daeguensis TaxID=414049 RepID=A0ABN1CWG2_9BURK|nr:MULTISPECIES: type I methionyl aminopeptidase [unclassified Pigmentiphaga]MDH2238678.1 type I methionyl aminopeptidase [Pigmentiphaga sp. GD03639]OVZ58972.1 type I methionyl aminopeptidase [Pigmentiphaga sp. NML030171]
MAITLKSPQEIEAMRVAGGMAAEVLEMIGEYVQPGVSTEELDRRCYEYITQVQKAIPANVGYHGFPKTLCTSINGVVCHGIPKPEDVLRDGDIINIDVTVIRDGWHGDTSRMFYAGTPSPEAERLVNVTLESMLRGIAAVRPGATLGDVGAAIQTYAEDAGFSVVRDFCGHGIGRKYHEAPQVLHYGRPNSGLRLKKGMVFTIEPMLNAGRHEVQVLDDDWTVVTVDGSWSAQWEHMVAVTDDGYDILTAWPNRR